MALQDFPQELHDHIIDALEEDRAALKACSLVMRCWLERSRKYIFESVSVRCDSTFPLDHYDAPEVTRHVRKVDVYPGGGADNFIHPTSEPSNSVATELSASQLLGRFPSTTELFLAGIDSSDSLSIQDRDAWMAAFPVVVRLSLRAWLIPMRTLLVFLSSFPHLKYVSIDALAFIPSQPTLSSALAPADCDWFPRPQLSSLYLCWMVETTVGMIARQWLSPASHAFADNFSLAWACVHPDTRMVSSEVLPALNTAVKSLKIYADRGRTMKDLGKRT